MGLGGSWHDDQKQNPASCHDPIPFFSTARYGTDGVRGVVA
jgi:hypothetical protein